MRSARQPGIHRVKPCLKNKQRRKGKGRKKRTWGLSYSLLCSWLWKKHPTKSNLRKEVWLWVTAQRTTVHRGWSPHVHSQEAKTQMNAVVPLTFSCPWPIGWCHPYSGWIFPPQLNVICSEVCLLHSSKSHRIDKVNHHTGCVAFHLTIPKLEPGRSEIQESFSNLVEFEASLGYTVSKKPTKWKV